MAQGRVSRAELRGTDNDFEILSWIKLCDALPRSPIPHRCGCVRLGIPPLPRQDNSSHIYTKNRPPRKEVWGLRKNVHSLLPGTTIHSGYPRCILPSPLYCQISGRSWSDSFVLSLLEDSRSVKHDAQSSSWTNGGQVQKRRSL
jgi:hypothetical protein